MKVRLTFTPLVLALAAPLGAQDVHVVDGAGAGDFLTIQEAVDVAARGDTLLVKGGDYPGFTIEGKIRAFHLELTAALASRLAATPEGDGSMLDNTLIVYLSDNSDKHHSSGTEWPLLMLGGLRGRAASGGRYLAYPRYGRASHRHTIGNLWTTVCHLTGEPVEHFGQADLALGDAALQRGPLDELLG